MLSATAGWGWGGNERGTRERLRAEGDCTAAAASGNRAVGRGRRSEAPEVRGGPCAFRTWWSRESFTG